MPLTDNLTSTQRAMLRKAHMQGPAVTIPVIPARALIRRGYLRQVTGVRMPTKGVTVTLTDLGRTWINA